MGANTDPQSMQAAIDQLEAAKRSRSERAGANDRREAKPKFGEQEGRPGIRPPKPPRDEPKIPGRPPGGRGDVRIQPFPFPGEDIARPLPWFPPRGDDQIGPGKPFPGRPIGDDQFPPREPPWMDGSPRPKEPPWMDGSPRPKEPPVEEHPWGREDDPNYAKNKQDWHQKRRDEDKQKMEAERFKRELMKRRGGIDFGPGRGGRVDRDVTRREMEKGMDAPVPGGEFLNPEEGLKGQEYMEFIKRLMRQKQGTFDR